MVISLSDYMNPLKNGGSRTTSKTIQWYDKHKSEIILVNVQPSYSRFRSAVSGIYAKLEQITGAWGQNSTINLALTRDFGIVRINLEEILANFSM